MNLNSIMRVPSDDYGDDGYPVYEYGYVLQPHEYVHGYVLP